MTVLGFTPDPGTKSSYSVSKSVSAGSTVIFWISVEQACSWTSSAGTLVLSRTNTNTGRTLYAWKAENVSAGTFTANATESTATVRNAILQAVEITGAATSGAVEAFDSNDTVGPSVQAAATGVTATAGATLLALWVFDRATTLTLAGYTAASQVDLGGAVVSEYDYKTAAGGSGNTAAGSVSPNAWFVGALLSIKAAGGGGTPPGLATETDTALALSGKQLRATGLASETDTALALTGVVPAGLPFNTSAYEFGQRTGLDVADFAIYASTALNVSVYAEADVLLASKLFSYTESTGTDGRLTRKNHASLTAGSWYIFVAVTTGGAMVAAGRIQAT